MVSVLQDGSKAYVANAGNAAAGVEGSVSVVNLVSGQVSATIPATSSTSATADTNTTPGAAYGHPTIIAATTGTPTGKVYVTSSDNKFLTVIETDTDTVVTHVNLQGLGVRVVVTAP
jgi:YVTN family beta-propeller protein